LAEHPDRLGGDSHYGRVEAMDWAEDNGTGYIFGLAGNAVLDAPVAEIATPTVLSALLTTDRSGAANP
jgi:hypothetical protein